MKLELGSPEIKLDQTYYQKSGQWRILKTSTLAESVAYGESNDTFARVSFVIVLHVSALVRFLSGALQTFVFCVHPVLVICISSISEDTFVFFFSEAILLLFRESSVPVIHSVLPGSSGIFCSSKPRPKGATVSIPSLDES